MVGAYFKPLWEFFNFIFYLSLYHNPQLCAHFAINTPEICNRLKDYVIPCSGDFFVGLYSKRMMTSHLFSSLKAAGLARKACFTAFTINVRRYDCQSICSRPADILKSLTKSSFALNSYLLSGIARPSKLLNPNYNR